MRAFFFRLLARDFRAGHLTLLGLALVLSVLAMSTVLSLADRFERSLKARAASLLAADALLVSDRPIQQNTVQDAQDLGFAVMQTAVFPGMVSVGDQAVLASIKAASSSYPLRGKLRLDNLASHQAQQTPSQLSRGTVWLEQSLFDRLQAKVGDRLKLGDAELQVGGVIKEEPDRVAAFINFAPRLLMHRDDLEGSGLIQEGSRITWRLGLAHTDSNQLKQWIARTEVALEKGQRIEAQDAGRPEIQLTMQRARSFLGLIASIIAIVACAAIALAAKHYARTHLKQYALMRVMGASAGYLLAMLMLQFLTVGMLAGGLGAALGVFTADFLASIIPGKLGQQLPPADLGVAAQAMLAGVLMLLSFSLGGWLQLLGVTPNVLFRDESPNTATRTASPIRWRHLTQSNLPWLVIAMSSLLLTVWLADSLRSAMLLWIGLMAVFFMLATVLAAIYRMGLELGEQLPTRFFATKLAMRRLGKTPLRRALQQSASTLGVIALLLLSFVQDDLISSWQRVAKQDMPDRFLINIQNDQFAEVLSFLEKIRQSDSQSLYPMVRGRLVARNGQPMDPQAFEELRARRLLDREFNLSYGEGPIESNRLIEGHWPRRGHADASVEQGLAKTLGLALGDELEFEVAGELVKARISSIRALSWESMRVNFFVVLSPQLLEDQAQSWIASIKTHGDPHFDRNLNSRFPNITSVDLSAAIEQAKSLVEQLATGLRWLFLLALMSGALVIASALQLEHEERQRDAALLRVLGATPFQLKAIFTVELLISGLTGGLLAGAFAYGLGLYLGTELLELSGYGSPSVIVIGIVLQLGVSLLSALISTQQLFRRSAGDALRLTN
jgi:putative ABC transport system permease protein